MFRLRSDDEQYLLEKGDSGNHWHDHLGHFAKKQDAHWKDGGAPLLQGLSLDHPPRDLEDWTDLKFVHPNWIDFLHAKPEDIGKMNTGGSPHEFAYAGKEPPKWLASHLSKIHNTNGKMVLPEDVKPYMTKHFTGDRPPEGWIDMRGIHPGSTMWDRNIPHVGSIVHPGTQSSAGAHVTNLRDKHGNRIDTSQIYHPDALWTVSHHFDLSEANIRSAMHEVRVGGHSWNFANVHEPDQSMSYIDNVPLRDVSRTMSALARYKHDKDFSEHAKNYVPQATYDRHKDHALRGVSTEADRIWHDRDSKDPDERLHWLNSLVHRDSVEIDPRGGLITGRGYDSKLNKDIPVRYSKELDRWTRG